VGPLDGRAQALYNVAVLGIVFLTTQAPSQFADDLLRAGYRVWEALAVSEVLHLCEHEDVDAVVIAPDVKDADIIEVQTRRVTLALKPGSTPTEVAWELSLLFPSACHSQVQ